RVFLWNNTDGKVLTSWLAHSGAIHSMQMPTAPQLMTAGADGLVKFWAMPPVAPRTLTHPDAVLAAVATPDGKKLFTGSADKVVRLWNLTSGAKERDYPGPTLPIVSVAMSGNGATIAAASADKTVTLWNTADAKVLQKLPLPAGPQAVAFSADAQSVYVGLA